MSARRLALAGIATLGLAAAACGGADAPAPLPDEEYLAVLCTGLERYATAVDTEAEAAGIAVAVVAFLDDLRAVAPPPDAGGFHAAFIAYLEEAVDDPTRPLAVAPPLPAAEVRARLARLERDVPECREPTFLASAGAER